MENFIHKTCSNCGSMKFKIWEDLTDDERFLIKKLPQNTEFTSEQRKRHLFCNRCLYDLVCEENKII
jgi:hypothetical protein